MLAEDELGQTLVHDQLAKSGQLQLDILRKLQVLLSCDEKLNELTWKNLFDLLGSVLSCCALVKKVMVRLADDSRLHANRSIRQRKWSFSILGDEGGRRDHSIPVMVSVVIIVSEDVPFVSDRASRALT